MKHLKIFAFLVLCLVLSVNSQSTKDIFSTREIVWFGLDFSNARFIGQEGFTDPQDIQSRFLIAWNNLINRK